MRKHLKEVNHGYIRYANCWEDADVLLEGLKINSNDSVLSIGSAGDNSFSILVNDPKKVIAVDVNIAQVNLIELKKAAFMIFEYDEFKQFLGFDHCSNRWELFKKLESCLSKEQIAYWNIEKEIIEKGVIFHGKFERYFTFFRKRILPLIHTTERVNQLFEKKTSKEQQEFHHRKWSNLRWKLLFKVFFSKYVLGKFGRDPQFLKEVEIPVSQFILEQSAQHLSSKECQQNYFLEFILKGEFSINLPHYARKENFNAIKRNIEKLEVQHGYVQDAFKKHGTFTKFNLSNIFEYMSMNDFNEIADQIDKNAEKESRIAYWNLMVPRRMSKKRVHLKNEGNQIKKVDFGFFYADFIVDVKA